METRLVNTDMIYPETVEIHVRRKRRMCTSEAPYMIQDWPGRPGAMTRAVICGQMGHDDMVWEPLRDVIVVYTGIGGPGIIQAPQYVYLDQDGEFNDLYSFCRYTCDSIEDLQEKCEKDGDEVYLYDVGDPEEMRDLGDTYPVDHLQMAALTMLGIDRSVEIVAECIGCDQYQEVIGGEAVGHVWVGGLRNAPRGFVCSTCITDRMSGNPDMTSEDAADAICEEVIDKKVEEKDYATRRESREACEEENN